MLSICVSKPGIKISINLITSHLLKFDKKKILFIKKTKFYLMLHFCLINYVIVESLIVFLVKFLFYLKTYFEVNNPI